MSHLPAEMTRAWLEKARRAEADLNAASQAPALFAPTFVETRRAAFDHATTQARFWHSQDVRSAR